MIHSLLLKNDLDITHEDTITSTIIGTLLHLPDQLFWEILREACFNNQNLPQNIGNLTEYEFWPKWISHGTTNTNYVEPDVFLRFQELDLIIEAKRFDDGGQYQGEWERELIAYENEYGVTDKPVLLVAIGGNGNNIRKEQLEINGQKRTIIKCAWANLHKILDDRRMDFQENHKRIIESLHIVCVPLGIRSYRQLDARPWVSDFNIMILDTYHDLIFRK